MDANASLGNALLLLDGSTLSGDGTVTSTVTVGEGVSLSPGNSPGTFHGTDFVWGAGGHYQFEVNDFTGTAGTNWDQLSLTGGLSITATAGSPFVIDLVSLDPTNVAGMAANFSANSTYDLLLALGHRRHQWIRPHAVLRQQHGLPEPGKWGSVEHRQSNQRGLPAFCRQQRGCSRTRHFSPVGDRRVWVVAEAQGLNPKPY